MGSLMIKNNFNNHPSDFLGEFFERSIFNDFWHPVEGVRDDQRDPQVTETENDYRISLIAPGVEKKDFSVSIENGTLLIGYDASTSEHSFARASTYNKTYSIPTQCDTKKITASHVNGILTVSIAKLENAKPRQIKIT